MTTPEPDEDFVDPADEYRMPWEEDMPVKDISLSEGVKSKAGSALSYAASIGLEISGSREFIADACELVLEFRDIFSTELSPEPAEDLPPLDVLIDTAKWHLPRNQGRPRNQSVEGQQEIKRHLEKLLESLLYFMRRLTLKCCWCLSPILRRSVWSWITVL